jgi:hypothetical protein
MTGSLNTKITQRSSVLPYVAVLGYDIRFCMHRYGFFGIQARYKEVTKGYSEIGIKTIKHLSSFRCSSTGNKYDVTLFLRDSLYSLSFSLSLSLSLSV